jgi:hypothetical protein
MGYKELAYSVVLQAIVDYQNRRKKGKSVAHLVNFFKSSWCDSLLCDIPITGEEIVERLQSGNVPKLRLPSKGCGDKTIFMEDIDD